MVQPEIRSFIVSCGLEYYKSEYFYALIYALKGKSQSTIKNVKRLAGKLQSQKAKYDLYSRLFFKPMMAQLSIDRTIHECRHTFATFAKRSKMDELARKLITGHAIQDFTDRVYTHYTLADLRREMDKLKILE